MLAGHDAAEAVGQFGGGVGHLLHRLDAVDLLQVDQGADVEAAGGGVGVEGGGGAVVGDHLLDGADVFGQVLDGDGDVLDDGDRLGVAADAHEEAEAGFAHAPDVGLLLGVEDALGLGGHADVFGAEVVLQAGAPLLQLEVGLAVELDGEDGGGIAVDEGDLGGVAGLGAGEVDQHPVHQLDGGGLGFEDGLGGGHRFDEVVELEEDEGGAPGDGLQLQGGGEDGGEGALRGSEKAGGVELAVRFEELVERVAGGAAPVGREVAGDEGRVLVAVGEEVGEQAAGRVGVGGAGGEVGEGGGAEVDDAAFGQGDADGADRVGGHAVEDGVGAGRVVGDDAADGGAVGRRRIRPEHEAVVLETLVEEVEVDAGLNGDGLGLGVDLQDAIEVLAGVNY